MSSESFSSSTGSCSRSERGSVFAGAYELSLRVSSLSWTREKERAGLDEGRVGKAHT